jgi:hypothetical protein
MNQSSMLVFNDAQVIVKAAKNRESEKAIMRDVSVFLYFSFNV